MSVSLTSDRTLGDLQLPFVSCLCPTYHRPQLLANSLACFLSQSYPADRRELIILDDAGQFSPQRGNGWELISVGRRFSSLPAKFNALAALARGDIYVVWEDDDVYLPWHIQAHVEVLTNDHFVSKPSRVRSHFQGVLSEEDAVGRFHASIAFTKEILTKVQGWPLTSRGDFDQQFLGLLASTGSVGDPVSSHAPSYIFRWESTQAYHGESFMQSADDEQWYVRAESAGSHEQTGPLIPVFDDHTRSCFSELTIDIPEMVESLLVGSGSV